MSDNSTCFHEISGKQSPPLIQNGRLVIQSKFIPSTFPIYGTNDTTVPPTAHHIGWLVAGVFTICATSVSLWLVNKHLQFYTNKYEQRYIVRILFMVPIYSIVSFASFLFWNHSTPLLLLRDCYESTVLTSFFYLLLLYVSPSDDEQRTTFLKVGLSKENDLQALQRGDPVKKWMFPLSSVKSKPSDGIYFLQIMKWGVLQYCVVRPLTTLAAVVLDHIGLYCESSWSPGWGHLYITTVVSISVSIAMYCLIQVYVPISEQLAPHSPLLKLFAVKAVVFLTFWQATLLSILSSFGAIKDTQYMTAADINIGIGAILETVEMTIFAFLHIKAFSYKPYQQPEFDQQDRPRTPRMRSLLHAFDFRETLRELWNGCVYIIQRWRGAETDVGARRLAIKEDVFGGAFRTATKHSKKARSGVGSGQDREHPLRIGVDVKKEVTVHVDSERQWLGTGDDYIFGLGFSRQERSAGFAEQVETELEQRGVSLWVSDDRTPERLTVRTCRPGRNQRSWWRRAYDRLSRTSADNEGELWNRGEGTRHPYGRGRDEMQYRHVPMIDHCYDDDIYPSSSRRYSFQPQDALNHSIDIDCPSSADVTSTHAALSRMFPNRPSLESSGPSSQTHPSSRGNHVRLVTPAPVVPSRNLRATENTPVLVNADASSPKSHGRLGQHDSSAEQNVYGSERNLLMAADVQRKRMITIEEDSSFGRRSKHRRDCAIYTRSSPISNTQSTAQRHESPRINQARSNENSFRHSLAQKKQLEIRGRRL